MSNYNLTISLPSKTASTPSSESAEAAKNYSILSKQYSEVSLSHQNQCANYSSICLSAASQLQEMDIFNLQGFLDCSSSPNFPSANAKDSFIISVAGKIGGSNGLEVSSADILWCMESSPSGDYETVGSKWVHIVNNLNGIVIGPSSSITDNLASFNATNGKLIKDSGLSISDVARISNLGTFSTLSNPLSAKGDILVRDSNGIVSLGVGTDGQVLTVDSEENSGLKWSSISSGGTSKWTNLNVGTDFNSSPTSSSIITMLTDQTSIIFPGTSLRYKISDVYYYGMCSSITSGSITVNGDPLSGTIQELSYGLLPPIQWTFLIPGYWGDSSDSSLIYDDLLINLKWRNEPSKIVKFLVNSKTVDSGTNKERINVRIGDTTSDYVSTSNSNNGLELTVAGTVYETTYDIEPTKNFLSYGSTIELKVQGNGTNKDSSDLQITMIFVVI